MAALHINICRQCGAEFESVRSDAKLCGARCRQASSRKARDLSQARFREEAAALVFDMQRAVIAGDAAALAETDRRGRELFGDGYPLAA